MDKKMWLRIAIASFLILVIGTISWQTLIVPNSDQLAISKVEAQELAQERYDGEIIDVVEHTNGFTITIQSDIGEYEISISRQTGEVEEIVQVKEIEQPQPLTEQDVEEIVLKDTPGTIEEISKKTEAEVEYYDAVVKDDQKTMIVKVNSETGDIVEKKEQKVEEKHEEKSSKEEKKVAKQEKKVAKQEKEIEKQNKNETKKPEKKEPVKNISEAEAIKIALDTVSGEVDDVDLESKNGQLYYFIEIETEDDLEAEIQIHAITGKVISIEWDD